MSFNALAATSHKVENEERATMATIMRSAQHAEGDGFKKLIKTLVPEHVPAGTPEEFAKAIGQG